MARQARKADPITSQEARIVAAGYDAKVKDRLMRIFNACGRMTDEELIRKYEGLYGVTPHSTIRTRRRELLTGGKLREVGELGIVVATGRRCQIYEVAR